MNFLKRGGISLRQFLLKVKDKFNLDSLKSLGVILYISDYTNTVGFECSEENVRFLENNDNVIEIVDACTGSLPVVP